MFNKKVLLIVLTAGLITNFKAHAEDPSNKKYTFGVLSQRSAVLTAEHWNPILDYVSRKTGVELELKIARTAPESNDALERGAYDFAYSNTIFLPRMSESGYKVLLKPQEEAINAQIVTLEDSNIKSLQDLNGRDVGFPSQAAFLGYAVPMDHLMRHSIKVTPIFGGNQEGIMGQLKNRKVIAAGVNGQVMKSYAKRENIAIKVLWQSEPFENLPISAHKSVSASVSDKVKKAFDEMDQDKEGKEILAASAKILGMPLPYGFKASSNADYSAYTSFYKNTVVKDIK